MMKGNLFVLVCLWGATPLTLAGTTRNGVITLATFDGASTTTRKWAEQNDPVMGGKSTGTFTTKGNLGVFDGEVVDVPFLKAPGFIKAVATETSSSSFADVSSCETIGLTARAKEDYAGFRLSFGNAHAPGTRYAHGYKANFAAPVGEEFGTVSIPIRNFTDDWDDATGNPVKTCQENSQYCPDAKTLQDMKTISIWAEGVKGTVHLEVKSIQAMGCKKEDTDDHYSLQPGVLVASQPLGLGKGRLCPAIPKSAKECPLKKNINDPEFEPVCVTRETPAELQLRRCMPGEKAPYYKDSEGVPNICHRGPGYGFDTTSRNATYDLGLGAVGEVGCAHCGAHLGDYFNSKDDDPKDHYCINGVCLAGPGQKPGAVCKPTINPDTAQTAATSAIVI